MHGVFEPLKQKRTELPKDVIMPVGNIDDRLNTWFENFKLIEFDAMDKDIKSLTSFQDAKDYFKYRRSEEHALNQR